MNSRICRNIRKFAYVPYAVYMVGFTIFGMWTMARQTHWLLPAGLLVLASWTCNVVLAGVNVVAAASAGVYGLMLQFGIPWFLALGLAALPLFLLTPVVWLAVHFAGPEMAAAPKPGPSTD